MSVIVEPRSRSAQLGHISLGDIEGNDDIEIVFMDICRGVMISDDAQTPVRRLF